MTITNDTARCSGVVGFNHERRECPQRQQCLRYTTRGVRSQAPGPWMMPPRTDGQCEWQIKPPMGDE